jgi:hypothetical protein
MFNYAGRDPENVRKSARMHFGFEWVLHQTGIEHVSRDVTAQVLGQASQFCNVAIRWLNVSG